MSAHGPEVLKAYQKASILIVCASRWEAAPFVEALSLQPDRREVFPFPVYQSEDGWVLCLCGIGATLACIATSSILAHCPTDSGRFLAANFGLAGADPGRWGVGTPLLVHRITDQPSGRSSYPERGVRSEWAEAALVTVPKPVWGRAESSKARLYDMEAFGFTAAAERFVTTSQLAVGKVVSDFVTAEAPPNWESITENLKPAYRRSALEFIGILRAQSDFLGSERRALAVEEVTPWLEELQAALSAKLRLTVHQARELHTALRAFGLLHSRQERETRRRELLSEVAGYEGTSKAERAAAHRDLLNRLRVL